MNTAVRMDAGVDKDALRAARVTDRHDRLLASDPQYRAAIPPEAVLQLKKQPDVRMAQLIAAVMETCADRPALGRRATRLVTDPETGRRCRQVSESFETMSYREVWRDVCALASVWQRDENIGVRPGNLVCILGFAGAGYVISDLAATCLGAVSVPLQTNAPLATLSSIVAEAEPRCLAASIECLEDAVEILLRGAAPAHLVVFEYLADDDSQREIYDRACARLAGAGIKTRIETLQAACERGRALGAPTPFVPRADQDPLTTIYYTSGSTGSPKGAMLGERMSSIAWRAPDARPFITLNYMPMNHSFGRILVFRTLAAGGTCYFAGKSDLSTLFEDLRQVRPTFINLVTRICEMIYQRYRTELAARGAHADPLAVETEVRDRKMGGRLMSAAFGAAPISADLHAFIERCLDVALPNGYGATEVMGVTMNNKVMRPPIIDWKLIDVPELGYFRTDKPHPRGELLLKSHTMMQGYYKKPEITATVFDEQGYYKTGDVMAQTGPDELIYVDRRNNVQKLAQGEFVAVAQLETTYTAGDPVIAQAYLYGTSDRPYLLGVIVPNPAVLAQEGIDRSDTIAVRSRLRRAIQQVAQTEELQSYEVPRDFIVELEPFSAQNGLLTGIGKPKRPSLKDRYKAPLEKLYSEIAAKQSGELDDLRREGRHLPVVETLTRAVRATLGVEAVDSSSAISFADLGGDSLSALSLSMLLEEIFDLEVPVGVITHPAGSLTKLALYIEQARQAGADRPTFASIHGRAAPVAYASDLTLEKFIDASTLERAAGLPPAVTTEPRVVLLTGANGYLGRFLCLEWLERCARTGGHLICVIRGASHAEARQRLVEAMDSGDASLLQHFNALAAEHLEVIAGDLAESDLGLDKATWRRLTSSVDLIVHPAALVNHVLPYSQLFGPNVVGTAELIRLALTEKLKRIVNVSTVAVAFAPGATPLDEDADVRVATPMRHVSDAGYASGYATSKWSAEVLLREVNTRFGIPISNFRSDMILAHTRYRGQLNVPDMFTRWVASVVWTGLAPRSFYREPAARAHYDGLPVDFTAASIVNVGEAALQGFSTFHVVNPHDDGISMDDFVDWMATSHSIERIESYADWLSRFETALKALPEKQRQLSFLPLLHQLSHPMTATPGAAVSAWRFHEAVRRVGVGSSQDIPHLDKVLIDKYLADLRSIGHLDSSL